MNAKRAFDMDQSYGSRVSGVRHGYVRNYFPGLEIPTGLAVWRFVARPATWFGRLVAGAISFLGVVLLNGSVFIVQPGWSDHLLKGLLLTARHLDEHDRQLAEAFAIIRTRYCSDEVLICHQAELFLRGFRRFKYHLPEYRDVLLTPDASIPGEGGRKLWLCYQRKTEFIDHWGMAQYKTLLPVVPPGEKVGVFASHCDVSRAELVDQSDGMLYAISSAAARR